MAAVKNGDENQAISFTPFLLKKNENEKTAMFENKNLKTLMILFYFILVI